MCANKLIPGKWYPVSESHRIADGDYVLAGKFTDKGEIRDCTTVDYRYGHFIDDTYNLEYHATHFMLIPGLED